VPHPPRAYSALLLARTGASGASTPVGGGGSTPAASGSPGAHGASIRPPAVARTGRLADAALPSATAPGMGTPDAGTTVQEFLAEHVLLWAQADEPTCEPGGGVDGDALRLTAAGDVMGDLPASPKCASHPGGSKRDPLPCTSATEAAAAARSGRPGLGPAGCGINATSTDLSPATPVAEMGLGPPALPDRPTGGVSGPSSWVIRAGPGAGAQLAAPELEPLPLLHRDVGLASATGMPPPQPPTRLEVPEGPRLMLYCGLRVRMGLHTGAQKCKQGKGLLLGGRAAGGFVTLFVHDRRPWS
jgi:hypothetical protein